MSRQAAGGAAAEDRADMSGYARIRESDFDEYPTALAARMASAFAIPAPVEAFEFSEKGNINRHTYRITAGGDAGHTFLLQQINPHVFRRPQVVMDSMLACINTQRRALDAQDGRGADAQGWHVVELLPTRAGAPYLVCEDLQGASTWRLMRRIPDSRAYKSLGEIHDPPERLRVAREAGRGLALFGDLTAGLKADALSSPLPGYRDTALYFHQLDAVLRGTRTADECADLLPADPAVRESTSLHFRVALPDAEARRRREQPAIRRALDLILEHRAFALTLQSERASGRIRTVAIHGDTKLDNFLFDTASGRVKALVDLDTIMPQTWLADWGDMVRSLCNVAGEKERDAERIRVDRDVFDAVADGFLSTASTVLETEVDRMVDAARIIALELAVRFLADYLRGDTYFKLGASDPVDLNRVRGLGQLTLFEQFSAEAEGLSACVARCRAGAHGGDGR